MGRALFFVAVLGVAAAVTAVAAARLSDADFPPAYSLPMAQPEQEPVVSAATTAGDHPVPMSLAEQQNALRDADAAQRAAAAARAHPLAEHPRVALGRGGYGGYAAPRDPLASIFGGTPFAPPQPPAPRGGHTVHTVQRGTAAQHLPRGMRAPAAPKPSLLEVGAAAGAGEEDDDEGDGPQGSRQVEYGGTKDQAYNLYEQFVPVVPTPLSPSPFVAHPAPKQNLYPVEHTRAQLTVSPDTGELTPNAGDGLQTTTMPYQYRPYIKQEKLHRGVDPLVYRSMYTWKPHSAAPGAGDVSVQGAIKSPMDIFKPRDWSVKIAQPSANIDIARRGADNFGADHSSPIAVPTMPPEFYQFSAPTPPMFHAPAAPEPRKAHADAALRAPDIFPSFLEEETSVAADADAASDSDSDVAATAAEAEAEAAVPAALKGSFTPHMHPPRRARHVRVATTAVPGRYRVARSTATTTTPSSTPLNDLVADPYWAALDARNAAALRASLDRLKALAQRRQAQTQAATQSTMAAAAAATATTTTAAAAPLATAPVAAAKQAAPGAAAAGAPSHTVQQAMQSEYRRMARAHGQLVSAQDQRDAAAGQRWHALAAKADRAPLTRYEQLQAAADRYPHQRYHDLHRALLNHPYDRYNELEAAAASAADPVTAPYDRYSALHTELYGVPPPPPPPPSSAADEARFAQAHSGAALAAGSEQAIAAELANDDEAFTTGAPPAAFRASAAAMARVDAELMEDDAEADAAALVEATAAAEDVAASPRHMALLYPSVRAAARQAKVPQP